MTRVRVVYDRAYDIEAEVNKVLEELGDNYIGLHVAGGEAYITVLIEYKTN